MTGYAVTRTKPRKRRRLRLWRGLLYLVALHIAAIIAFHAYWTYAQ